MPVTSWSLVPGFIMPGDGEITLYPDYDPSDVKFLSIDDFAYLVAFDEKGVPWVQAQDVYEAIKIHKLTDNGIEQTKYLAQTNTAGFAYHSQDDKVVYPTSNEVADYKVHVQIGSEVFTYDYGTPSSNPCSCPDPSTCTESGRPIYPGSMRQIRGQRMALWQKGYEVWKVVHSASVLSFSKVLDECPRGTIPYTQLALVDDVAFFVKGYQSPDPSDKFEIWRSTFPYSTWAKVAEFPYPYRNRSMERFTAGVGKLPDGRYYMLANTVSTSPPTYLVPRLFVSNDGITWSDAGPTDLPPSDAVSAWTHSGTKAWAIACSSSGCALYWSSNGLNWYYVAPAYSSLGNVYAVAVSEDVNPVDVIVDVLSRIGLPCPIDEASFNAARSWTESNGIKISGVLEAQQSALQVIEQILTHSFLMLVYSQGKLKLIPRREETVTRELKISDAIENQAAAFSMGGLRDTKNRVRVDYTNRAHAYNTSQAYVSDDLNRFSTGERSVNIGLPWITNAGTAKKVAARYLRELSVPRTMVEVTLGPQDVTLQPGDVVTVTYPEIGMEQQPVRILSISESPDGETYRVQMVTEPTASLAIVDHPVESPNPGPSPPPLDEDPGPTGVSFCELPHEISGPRIQLAFSFASASDSWRGCTVYVSTDGGISYSPLATYLGAPMQSGSVSDFPDVSSGYHGQEEFVVDLTQTRNNTLVSTDRDSALAITNRAILGREIISYREAQLISPGVWRVAGLFRGRYEMQPYVDGTFGLLDSAFVVDIPYEWEGRDLLFKVASINRYGVEQDLANVIPFSYTVRGIALRPDPVQGLQAVINGEDGLSLVVVGVGQVAFSAKWRYSHPSVGEDADLVYGNEPSAKDPSFGAYVVRVYTKSSQGGAYVLRRTVETTSEQYTYTVLENISDAGSYQRFCKFEVSARNIDMRESWPQTLEMVALP